MLPSPLPDDDRQEPVDATPDSRGRSGSFSLVGLFVLAALVALYLARAVVLPLVLAALFSLLLAPVVRLFRRIHVPRWLAAAVVVGGFVGLLAGGVYYLASPAADWMERAPASLRRAEIKLRHLKAPVEKVKSATQEVERITEVDGGSGQQKVQVQESTMTENLTETAVTVASAGLVTLVILYFLLASGDRFLRKLVGLLPTYQSRETAVQIARRVERSVSTYLLTITLINSGLGMAVGTALWLLDVPNPILWGTMAALLNFVPYLGAMVGITVVALVSFLSFDAPQAMLLPPACYLALTALEGSFLTPTILGRQLTLNPLMVFIGIIFWGWLWGAVGAILAVPLLATFKIVCDNVESLKPVGQVLGR